MARFTRSVLIDAPVEEVFGFHEREDALALLSPGFPRVRVISRSGGLRPGSRVEMRIGGMRLVARHTALEKNSLFVDEQVEGPFRVWVHRHEFEDVGVKTRLTDRVEYELRGGWLVNVLLGWVADLGLRAMFGYRHRVTKRLCEKG